MMRFFRRLIADTNPLRLLYHRLKAWCAVFAFGWPSRKLTVICVTGTDGKTTTVAMIAHILEKAGIPAGATSSAFLQVRGKRTSNPTQKTSLSPFDLQRFLRSLVKDGCTHVIIETSSHGLMQGRLAGIRPAVTAITNISEEHLDYHRSMEAYIKAKSMLFFALKGKGTKVLNMDDRTFVSYREIPSSRTLTYGAQENQASGPASFLLTEITAQRASSHAVLKAHEHDYPLSVPLPGTFNLWNAACAIACTEAVGIDVGASVAALQSFNGAPGRMQSIDEGQPFNVYIDFTVTPVAYERTLSCLKEMLGDGGRLLVLTGSCGDRMREKRPLVGKICATYGDIVAVTNEDPYTEDPERIIDEVLAGVPESMPVLSPREHDDVSQLRFVARISDRRTAIRFLLRQARAGDIVIFCGKGGDVTMWTAQGRVPWDEDQVVREELQALTSGRK